MGHSFFGRGSEVGSGAGLGQEVGEAVEVLLPPGPPGRQPLLGRAQARRLDLHGADTADLLRLHQPGGLEHLHVLDDRGQRHGERLRQLAHRRRAVAEPFDDGTAGRIGEGLEGVVEHRGIRIVHARAIVK